MTIKFQGLPSCLNEACGSWNRAHCSRIDTPLNFNLYYKLVGNKDFCTSIPYYLLHSCGLSRNALHIHETIVQTLCKCLRKIAHNFRNSIVTPWFILCIFLLRRNASLS